MKKAVQPKTATESKFDQFDTASLLSTTDQGLIKGGDGDDDTGIIVEEVIEH